MTEPFYITVHHKGAEKNFPAQLQLSGYTYRFRVLVENQEIFIEKDEEGEYRAITHGDNKTGNLIDKALIEAIISSLKTILA